MNKKSSSEQLSGNCKYNIPDYDITFKIVSPKQGEHYRGHKFENHSLVFLLNGEVEFSYNDFLNRRFCTGDMFFIPQAAEIFGVAITNATMLVLTFNNQVESMCNRCRLSEYTQLIKEINYDFRSLRITDTLYTFINQVNEYINKELKCHYLYELKQKELFIIMGTEYCERELVELFYPISGGNIDFRNRVMANYRYGLDVFKLAEKFGMSYSPFLRKFKEEFGMPAKKWMQKQKAKHIILRLSMPSTTVSDIVREFEFTDLPHFIRFCKKQYGYTPKALIKSIRNIKTEV